MKPTAVLINTSRGPIVDQQALLDALHDGRIAGAGLDVFDQEPLPADHPLRSAPRTVLTPHLGYVTRKHLRGLLRRGRRGRRRLPGRRAGPGSRRDLMMGRVVDHGMDTSCRTRGRRRLAALLIAFLALTGLSTTAADAKDNGLPRVNVSKTYVTGISSGGYMATQLQVAHSSRFAGAAIFSAGPYYCALNNVAVALQSCTASTAPTPMPVLYATTDGYARQGKIDATANLARSRTYFFHGTLDPTVVRPVADNLATYYGHYGVPLTYRNQLAAGHGWLSPLGPVACADTAPPYINNCAPYDAQADSLRTMFGSVKAPNTATPRGALTAFSQDRYAVPPVAGNGDVTRTGAAAIGMGGTGYVYTPDTCANGATLRRRPRVARLPADGRADRRHLRPPVRPQRLRRHQQLRRPLPAGPAGRRPGHLQPQGLLGLVGLPRPERRRLREQARPADAHRHEHGAGARRLNRGVVRQPAASRRPLSTAVGGTASSTYSPGAGSIGGCASLPGDDGAGTSSPDCSMVHGAQVSHQLPVCRSAEARHSSGSGPGSPPTKYEAFGLPGGLTRLWM